MNKEQIQRIEELLSHQDQQIQDLSDMIVHQGKDIKHLKSHIRKLEGRFDTMKDEQETGDDDQGLSISDMAARDKPPHY